MSPSVLTTELAHLDEKIELVRRKHKELEGELRGVDAELARLSADRERFAAVQDFCKAFDRLRELKADDIFREGGAQPGQIAGYVERASSRVARFEEELSGILEQQASLKKQISGCLDELEILDAEVCDAYARNARRAEEYLIERDISPVPDRTMVMPWSPDAESERRFRKALLIALLCAFVVGTLIPLLKVPAPLRPAVVVVPERLVSMLREERHREAPPKEEKKPEKEEKKPEKEQEEKTPKENLPKPSAEETQAARKKAERAGVLAYKENFKELVADAPASRFGAHARLDSQPAAAGPARPGRSLVALPPTGAGSSGGISNSVVSRTVGNTGDNRIESVGLTRVQSTDAGPAEEPKPVSSGPRPAGSAPAARTDEEIQLVFDKYKASLYRMYNVELRKNPTLRGKLVLRITIAPGGEVSACVVQSNDLNSPELAAQIVERVKRFNFGSKGNVPITILYPIDFLPGG